MKIDRNTVLHAVGRDTKFSAARLISTEEPKRYGTRLQTRGPALTLITLILSPSTRDHSLRALNGIHYCQYTALSQKDQKSIATMHWASKKCIIYTYGECMVECLFI